MSLEPTPAAVQRRCGDGRINREDEQCDGSVLPMTAPPGSTCNANGTLQLPNFPRCGDGTIDSW